MPFRETPLPGLWIFEPRVFEDERGYFFESFNQQIFEEHLAHPVRFVQDNQSKSGYGVIRGLHFQRGDYAQAKLVRVLSGRVLDVALDIRPESPTFGQHFALELSAANRLQLFIPRGFAHGFAVLSETAEFFYKCDNFYAPQHEGGILYNDPQLNIDWQIPAELQIISAKDKTQPLFASLVGQV
ncbi:dTDP-4-dehydrorhamnose 3,5-epimerase [Rhodoflexus caldus]|uniref:dTDP-4-dehydrorhamnose 3,5-epimerase n=1 Tax=Rhodoflexus caldus TaxID=2891236 RepID=UPI00202A345D|nr:dTDP-4-dehydrorhamnose 3,5-epimerase [Rhodoflexus caldus]